MGDCARKMGLIALIVSLMVGAWAQRTVKHHVSSNPKRHAKILYYKAKEGDSLYKIAHRFGLRLPDLLRVNRLSNPHNIKPGDVIRVPVKSTPATQPKPPSLRASRSQVTRRNPSRTATMLELSGKSNTAQRVLQIAHRYLGHPYRYGGSSARGFDCSGFVLHVYRSIGSNLPHSASAQARMGKPVPRHQLQPGDLVFFCTRGRRISHVGIYIGNGKFIHASSARGRVRIDSLNEGYYKRRYAGACRINH